MDKNFWLQKWSTNEIAFHEREANPALVKYFNKLSLPRGGRIFVPLCGKTLDIAWLLSQGYRVAGAELIELAIQQLFQELKIKPQISQSNQTIHYSGPNIDIFVGDIFKLSKEILGPVDAVYDRAALVALPKDIRIRYTAHIKNITNHASQLLVTYEYDQQLMSGPPFSVNNEEVKKHYNDVYNLTLLETNDVSGGLKGQCPAKENIWLLNTK